MKKLVLVLLAAITTLSAIYAQPAKIGAGLALTSGYHFKNENFDLNKSGNLAFALKHVHKISLPIELAPSFVFFFPHVFNNLYEKTTIKTIIVDIDGHYIFNSLDKFEFYGLAGLDILMTWKKDRYSSTAPTSPNGTPLPPGTETTYKDGDKALGLNLGAGSYMKLTNQFDLYGEIKYILGKYDQLMVNVGIIINVDWLKKHENTDL
jgi:hypothetical protein